MEYIIFLATIQLPFLYLIWKMTHNHILNLNKNLQVLKKQNEHIANFMDTLRMSVEKISEDLYGSGRVNSRMFQIEKEILELKDRLQQMETYTGLTTNNNVEFSSSGSLKEKDFS